jgi:hypothetical protein
MKIETRLIKYHRELDNLKNECIRFDTARNRIETDSILYIKVVMLQCQIATLLVKLDAMKHRRYTY